MKVTSDAVQSLRRRENAHLIQAMTVATKVGRGERAHLIKLYMTVAIFSPLNLLVMIAAIK
jgi:hypothetical protein